jgi:hypothetical protein
VNESILPAGVAAVASQLSEWPAMQHFYLAGGTALALQMGHRQSRDLDFFTTQPMTALPDLPGLDPFLQRFDRVEWVQRLPDQIHWRLEDVSVTLLAYPFLHHQAFLVWRGLSVADARDIAVQKAYTIGRRAHARDYLDLHCVLMSGVASLDEVMQQAQATYHDAFSPRLFLQQLTYTQDVPDWDEALTLLTRPQSFAVIERDLQAVVRSWAQRAFSPAPSCPKGPSL